MGIDHTQRRKAGNIGEDAVCGFLVRHGYEIIKSMALLPPLKRLSIRSSSGISFRQHRLFVRGF